MDSVVKAGFGIDFITHLKTEIVCSVVFREDTGSSNSSNEGNSGNVTHRIVTFHRDGSLNLWNMKAAMGIKVLRSIRPPYSFEYLVYSPVLSLIIGMTNQNAIAV